MNKADRHDLQLDRDSFHAIAALAYRESGLTLVEEKTMMIQSRLRHRLRALKLANFAQYCDLVTSDDGQDERKRLISALTTNVSHFFRENHHFDALLEYVESALPDLQKGGRIRIWSAGCSNGQEAFSIVIRLLERFPEIASLNLRILATDIDPEVVRFARKGSYSERLVNGVSQPLLHKHFQKTTAGNGETVYTVSAEIQSLIQFNELNLLGNWPMKSRFDAVFCRNVVIYFDTKTQRDLWPRFHQILRPDGLLFLGHSERIADPEMVGFHCNGPTIYRPQSS